MVQITWRGETERQWERNEGGGRGGIVLERDGKRKVGREREREREWWESTYHSPAHSLRKIRGLTHHGGKSLFYYWPNSSRTEDRGLIYALLSVKGVDNSLPTPKVPAPTFHSGQKEVSLTVAFEKILRKCAKKKKNGISLQVSETSCRRLNFLYPDWKPRNPQLTAEIAGTSDHLRLNTIAW